MSIAPERTWSPQQAQAIDKCAAWIKDPHRTQVFHMFGFAGSGKTTLALKLADIAREELNRPTAAGSTLQHSHDDGLNRSHKRVLFAAFTGKAALVMRQKGCAGAQTIHSLIYINLNPPHLQPKWELNEDDSPLLNAGLLIVDECSMLGPDLGKDLLSFGVPVLVLGDPFQLPPIHGQGFFDTHSPEVMLTEIHRQAQDSPIIKMSMDIREGKGLKRGNWGESKVLAKAAIPKEHVIAADQVIVGRNATREAYNRTMRYLNGYDSLIPLPGEKLICLKNNRELGVFNGGMWTVESCGERPTSSVLDISMTSNDVENQEIEAEVPQEFFLGDKAVAKLDPRERAKYNEFTYGYAITCHKSQGSQWPHVVIFDESRVFREHAQRWLYTAVTRASEHVTVGV